MSIKEMKRISKQIINEELSAKGIKINIFPLTFVEYYDNYVFKDKLKIVKKLPLVLTPLYAGGFNDLKGNTVVFLNHINKIKKIEDRIFRLAEVSYHEARHSVQLQWNKNSYEGFLRDMDSFLMRTSDYFFQHDKYYFEIDANIYGVVKAEEYLEKNYPKLYEKEKRKIEKKIRKYKLDMQMYDPSDTVHRAINRYKIISGIRESQITKKVNKVIKNESFKIKSMEDISPVLSIFLNKDGSFKEISKIINDDRFQKLDIRIISAFLSSKSFLEQIDMSSLTAYELEIVNKSLQYTFDIYKRQVEIIKNNFYNKDIDVLEYLKSNKTLLEKINVIKHYVGKKIKPIISVYRDEYERREHMKSIPKYLEESNQIIKKRNNRGFLTINLCYLIGGLISIVTIIVLILQ